MHLSKIKCLFGLVFISSFAATNTVFADKPLNNLTKQQVEGLQVAGQAVLKARKQNRDMIDLSVFRTNLEIYRKALYRLHSELTRVTTPVNTIDIQGATDTKSLSDKSTGSVTRTRQQLVTSVHRAYRVWLNEAEKNKASDISDIKKGKIPAQLVSKIRGHEKRLNKLDGDSILEYLSVIDELLKLTEIKDLHNLAPVLDSSSDGAVHQETTPTLSVNTRHRR